MDTLLRTNTRRRGDRRARAAMLVAVSLTAAVVSAGHAQDAGDRPYISAFLNQVLETERTNVEVPWSNPETGNTGTIEITRTYYRDAGTPCRDYVRTLERPGSRPTVTNGTGCRVGAGRWQLEERTATTAAAPPSASPPPPSPADWEAPPAAPPAAEPPPGDTAAACPDPVPPLAAGVEPPTTVVLPTGKPPAFVAYTLPSRAPL